MKASEKNNAIIADGWLHYITYSQRHFTKSGLSSSCVAEKASKYRRSTEWNWNLGKLIYSFSVFPLGLIHIS